MIKERISVLEDRKQKMPNLKQRENRLKKINKDSEFYGAITKNPTLTSSESQKERRKNKNVSLKKSIQRNIEISPNLANGINRHIEETEWTPNKRNSKKYIPRHIVINQLKTNKEKSLENSQRKTIC